MSPDESGCKSVDAGVRMHESGCMSPDESGCMSPDESRCMSPDESRCMILDA